MHKIDKGLYTRIHRFKYRFDDYGRGKSIVAKKRIKRGLKKRAKRILTKIINSNNF